MMRTKAAISTPRFGNTTWLLVTDPGEKFTRYVMVADSGAGWLMVHDLWDEEAAQLLQEISATAIPEEPTT